MAKLSKRKNKIMYKKGLHKKQTAPKGGSRL